LNCYGETPIKFYRRKTAVSLDYLQWQNAPLPFLACFRYYISKHRHTYHYARVSVPLNTFLSNWRIIINLRMNITPLKTSETLNSVLLV